MKIKTYLFGEIEVNPENIFNFPNGLVGFEACKRFFLAHDHSQTAPSSYTLQSVDDPELAFEIIDPVTVGFHYELALSDAENAILQNPAADDVSVMLLVFKQDEDAASRLGANVRAPLILNTRSRVGIQKVLEKPRSNILISNLSNPV